MEKVPETKGSELQTFFPKGERGGPLCRGLLGGNLTEYSDLKTNDIRGAWPRFEPGAIRSNIRIVEALNEFGKTRGMTSS